MTQSPIHQTHLESAKEQLQGILNEIQQLNNQVAVKRETALKIQGVIAVSYTHLTLPTKA